MLSSVIFAVCGILVQEIVSFGKRYFYIRAALPLCEASGIIISNILNHLKFYFHHPYSVNTSIGL
jgi:hypothetical protein